MKKLLRKLNRDTSLAVKIRITYIALMALLIFFLVLCLTNLWQTNARYGELIEAAGIASDFSLDFKKDYDYETYLLIVENKSPEKSELPRLLQEAGRILASLEEQGTSSVNEDRLESVKKYLRNLDVYRTRILKNLEDGNKYEENIEIWENDVQIVTSLLRESMLQYIYYEIQEMQNTCDLYNKEFTNLIKWLLIGSGILTVGVGILCYYLPKTITKPLTQLGEVANKIAGGDLTVRADVGYGADIGVLADSFNTMIDKVNLLLKQVTEEQIHLREAELELLQSQINPHFLYNTLDTIVWLAESGEQKKVVSMVRDLSDFFRTSLNQGKDTISIREELQHVSSYLRIQHVRYADILEYEIDVPQELYDYVIPKITIQPLVENALYHGIKNKRGKGHIFVSGEALEDCLILKVSDDGIGMQPERLARVQAAMHDKAPGDGEIFGLYNVNERIALRFGEEYGLRVDSTYGEGTMAEIKLPREQNKKIQPTE